MAAGAFEKDPAIKEEKMKTIIAETLPFYLEKFEALAKANNGHLALKRLTWADFFFTNSCDFLKAVTKEGLTDKHPNLQKVVKNVESIDSIKKWIAERPKSDM